RRCALASRPTGAWPWSLSRQQSTQSGRPLTTSRRRLRDFGQRTQIDTRSRSLRQPEHAVFHFDAIERVVEQPVEFTQLPGIVHAGERAGKMQGLGGEQPTADRSTKPVLNVRRLAQPSGGQRVSQAAELRDLETDRIDRSP